MIQNKLKRKIYLLAGLFFASLGLIGYILPIIPGTIFMIVAAYCFLNSSKRLYNRIVNDPHIGEPIKNYIENNFISRKSKFIILLSIWGASSISLFYFQVNIYIKAFGFLISLIGSAVVLRAQS